VVVLVALEHLAIINMDSRFISVVCILKDFVLSGDIFKVKASNVKLALKAQLPWKRAFKNFFITGNAWGMFSRNSHTNSHTQVDKIGYSLQSAIKSAEKMKQKTGKHFSLYKCIFCDKYHIGKNKDNK